VGVAEGRSSQALVAHYANSRSLSIAF